MITWEEAHKAYTEDLIHHYEIGKAIGLIDGAVLAYTDIQTAINLEPVPTIPELNEILQKTLDSYKNKLEKE